MNKKFVYQVGNNKKVKKIKVRVNSTLQLLFKTLNIVVQWCRLLLQMLLLSIKGSLILQIISCVQCNFNLNFFSSIAQLRKSGGQWTISSKYVHDQEVITSIQKLLQCTEQRSSNITQYSPSSNSICCQVLAHRHGNNRSK